MNASHRADLSLPLSYFLTTDWCVAWCWGRDGGGPDV